MNNRSCNRAGAMRQASRGFTLVECALAMVVIAIGVIAAFALISTGLDSSAKAVAETRAAIFADDVFNGLRSKSVLAYDSGDETAWERFWDEFMADTERITVAAGEMWQIEPVVIPGWPPVIVTNTLEVEYQPYGTEPARTIVFTNYSYRLDELTEVVNNALRYNLDVEVSEVPRSPGVPGSPDWTNKVIVVLNVWEGEFGETPLNRALTFTTEIPNSGGL